MRKGWNNKLKARRKKKTEKQLKHCSHLHFFRDKVLKVTRVFLIFFYQLVINHI